ncbi:MAG: hypothetical protein A2Y18_06910 [Clostridiales bacterium GWD2_32_19]|nr:MAG: hypothetical protein A2Y18_06910 [Clostridiales bacterium GWD2_32_19]
MAKEIMLYQTEDGKINFEVKLEEETVWLSQKQMAELFDKNVDTIGLHIKDIYETNELDKNSTTEDFSVVQKEGKRAIKCYNRISNIW